jgi:PAS domain S-box-containing protein
MKKNTPSNIINPQSLRVLIVEDSEDDALLIIRELKKGGYNPVYERVETAAAMKKALKEKQWDIILCDYKMPKFSGAQAIALLKETNIYIPLIIISGTIGEETAIECMRSGAHDYIIKNRLSRLCPAIARELEEAEVRNKQRQAENALRESETKLQAIFDKVGTGIFIIDTDTQIITEANQAAIEMTGLSKERIIGQICNSLVCPALAGKCPVKDLGQSIHQSERKLLHADGHQIDILKTVYPIKMNGRNCYLESFIDISNRKRAEGALKNSEEKYRSILKNIEDGYYEVDIKGNFTFFNDSMCRIIGYSPEEMMGMNNRQFTDKENAKKLFKTFNEVYRTGVTAKALDWQIIKKDETKRFIEVSVSLQKNSSGKPIGFHGIARDVTERKQTEEVLRRSEEKYRLIAENMADLIAVTDMNLRFTYISPSIMRTHGFTVEEAMNMTLDQFMTPGSMQILLTVFEEEMKLEAAGTADPGRIRILEFEEYKKDGSIICVENSISAQRDKENKMIGILAVSRDITDRKRVEGALQESEKYFKEITENSSDIIIITDKNGNIKYCSRSIERFTGYKPDELIGRVALTLIHPDDKKRAVSDYGKAILAKDSAIPNAFRIVHKDGSERYFEGLGKNLLDNPTVAGFIMNVHDITERKKMEEDLRQSEEKYRTILDEMEDAYFEVDIAGNYTFVNDSVCHHLGYTREELIGTSFRDQIVKEDLGKVYKAFGNIYITGKPERGILYKILRKGGTTGFGEMTGFPLKNQQGEIIGFRGVGQDVSERKKIEEDLRQSEQRYRSILDEMEDAYFEVDLAGNYTFLNDACCRHLGYPREELIGTTFRGQMAKEDIGMIYDTCAKILRTGKPEKISSYKILRKDKITGYTKMTVFPLKNQQGEIIGLRGVGQDVTESKRAEEERKQSFDRLRKALGATVQSISTIVEMKDPYTAGHQQRVSDLSRSIATEMGLSADRRDFIRTASAIHDIGKISIPAEILSKPTKLTDMEFNLIKTHSQSGHDILKDIEFPWPVADVVLQHHERMDGSGYPQGLKGDDILLEARIMAVADVVEAIGSHRPYRPSLGIDFALDEISRNKGILYDADVVDACLKLFQEKGYTLVFKKS